VDEGADLSGMSSWQWDGDMDGSDSWDYALGNGGYAGLLA